MGKNEWYKKEFLDISKEINRKSELNHYYFLRIRNLKLQRFSRAKEEDIVKITRDAFELVKDNKEDIIGAIKRLMELDGVGVPIASAILAMVYPNRFAIIDINTITALGRREWIVKDKIDPSCYKEYIALVKEKQKEGFKTLRDAEFSLFEKGQEIRKANRKALKSGNNNLNSS